MKKKQKGYIYNHTRRKYLEIYIFSNESHLLRETEKRAFNDDNISKIIKKESAKPYGITKYKIFYDEKERIKDFLSFLNDSQVDYIKNYETIDTIKDLFKNVFR